jgi:hypothetical protein
MPIPPDLVSTSGFDGYGADGLAEPPSPSMAASPSHLLQTTAVGVRILTRDTVWLMDVSLETLFGLEPGETADMARVLWDPAHKRWVGSSLSFGPGDATFLNVAVSDAADPTGTWSTFGFQPQIWVDGVTPGYHYVLPDFPALALSSDKIVLAANLFQLDFGGAFRGSGIWVLPWSEVLATGSATAHFETRSTLFSVRPANNLSPSAAVHLVATDASDSVVYARVTGTGATLAISDFVVVPSLDPLWDTGAPYSLSPRQPGSPATIAHSSNDVITDAVWANGHLWFVSNYPKSFDGGSTWNLTARSTDIAVSTGAPVANGDWYAEGDGTDYFMPAVGVSADGTVFLTWNRSSPLEYVSLEAVASQTGDNWSLPITLASSSSPYTMFSGRWGYSVGIAQDPVGSAAVWQTGEAVRADGKWTTVISRLVMDSVLPAVTAPTQELVAGTTLNQQVSVRVRWTASDAGSGLAGVWVGRCTASPCSDPLYMGWQTGTSFTTREYWVASPPAPTDLSWRYQYAVSATDNYGNTSPDVTGLALAPVVTQQTTSVTYSGVWKNASGANYSGGSIKYSTAAGAKATFTFNGRSVAVVSYKAPGRGKVKIYLDGKLKGTFSLANATAQARRLVYATTTTAATHKLQLVVVSGRVDVDAFVVLK